MDFLLFELLFPNGVSDDGLMKTGRKRFAFGLFRIIQGGGQWQDFMPGEPFQYPSPVFRSDRVKPVFECDEAVKAVPQQSCSVHGSSCLGV